MRLKAVESKVREVLEENIEARNDNFILILKVYEKIGMPVDYSFLTIMNKHSNFKAIPFESILRARRKIVRKHPELQGENVKKLRIEQEEQYFDYAIGG